MKLNILLIILIISCLGFMPTQHKYNFSNKITYKLVYVPDSTNPEDKRYEFMYLFYQNGISYFQSQSGYRTDSAKGTLYLNNPISDIIIKNGLDSIMTIGRIPSYYYSYMEPQKIIWQILPDTLSIGKFICQKAVTQLGKRQWTIWFAPDIPISDGPYKFSGLPGLILRAEDSQHFFVFTFIELEHKITNIDKNLYTEAKQTTKRKYFTLRKAYRENPLPFESQDKTFTSGKNAIMERVKAKINKNNNLIERPLN